MPLPLDGVRVIDLTQVMGGPFCTMQLGDLGADVIKVEPPAGDLSRSLGGAQLEMPGDDNAPFFALNRNKRSIVLDLTTETDRSVFMALVRTADVLVESFRPGVTKRLGVDYDTVAAVNPGLIYASISGFGQTGPYADRPGFDLIAQGMSGIMSITGEPGGPPAKSGTSIADINAGILAALGIVSALVARQASGRGQMVETSLMEAAIQQTYWQAAIFFATGKNSEPTGSAHILTAPYQAFPTRDGWINIGGANQSNWERIVKVIGRPELADDARFRTNNDRMKNLAALTPLIAERLKSRTSADWIGEFEAAGVPVGPVNKIGDMLADPQVAARDMVVEVDHPRAGRVKALGHPIKFSGTPGEQRRPAPLLGEHTREVLAEIGYAAAEIEAFIREGAVAAA